LVGATIKGAYRETAEPDDYDEDAANVFERLRALNNFPYGTVIRMDDSGLNRFIVDLHVGLIFEALR